MSERPGYIPPEVRQEAEAETTPEKPKLRPETVSNIQHGPPEATGERIHWHTPDGNLITPEKEEIYRSPETLPEKEPGYGPKPSFSDDPSKAGSDGPSDTPTDDPANDIESAEEDS